MDDAPDGRYARAPELEDLLTLCRALNAEGARYVLIGGFAVILHGSGRGTKDIDLLLYPSEDTIRDSDRIDVAFLRLLIEEEAKLRR